MKQNLTFAFIGGDPRQVQAISRLASDGHSIRTLALEQASFPVGLPIHEASDLKTCLMGADIVLLPLPYSNGEETICTPFSKKTVYCSDILREMKPHQLLLVGRADPKLQALADLYSIHVIDYAKREELAILNSIPTAEGALEIALRETPHTIHNSRCLILGYGRIGKHLGMILQGLGAKVTVAARKESDLAWIRARGMDGIPFSTLAEHLQDWDIVWNTVPAMVLDFKLLSRLSDHCLILDLASRPGGVDFDTAQILGKKVIWALSLPGKCAPETAGDIIKDTIVHILEELGV